jgi:hypothetical protein
MDDQPDPECHERKAEDLSGAPDISKSHSRQKAYQRAEQAYKTAQRIGKRLKQTAGRLTTSEWITAVFTAVIAVATVWNVVVVRGSLGIMQGQLDEMRADQRPWVSINVEAEGQEIAVTEPLSFSQAAGSMRLNLVQRNTGKDPAIGVRWSGKIVGIKGGRFEKDEIADDMNSYCDPIRKQSAGILEDTVFPGDKIIVDLPVAIYPAAIKQTIDSGFGNKMGLPGEATFDVIVCADYRDAENLHHQTRYSYLLGTPRKNGAIMTFLKPQGVHPEMRLVPFTQSSD